MLFESPNTFECVNVHPTFLAGQFESLKQLADALASLGPLLAYCLWAISKND